MIRKIFLSVILVAIASSVWASKVVKRSRLAQIMLRQRERRDWRNQGRPLIPIGCSCGSSLRVEGWTSKVIMQNIEALRARKVVVERALADGDFNGPECVGLKRDLSVILNALVYWDSLLTVEGMVD